MNFNGQLPFNSKLFYNPCFPAKVPDILSPRAGRFDRALSELRTIMASYHI